MKKEELEENIRSGLSTFDDYMNLGNIYLEEGRYDDTLSLYKELKNRDLSVIEKARILSEEGHVLDLSNRDNESITAFHDSLRELITCTDCDDCIDLKAFNHYSLFTLYDSQNEIQKHAEEALKYLNLIIEKYQNVMPLYEAYSYIAEIYLRTDKFDKALSTYEKALEFASDNKAVLPIITGMAVIHGKMNNYDKSKEYFANVLEKAKNNDNVPMSKIYFDMGIAAFENNYFKDAVEYFLDALRLKNYTAFLKANIEYEIDILWHLAFINYELDDDENTLKYSSQLLSMINNDHHYFVNANIILGHYYTRNRENEKAQECYKRVLTAPSATFDDIATVKEYLLGEKRGKVLH